MDCRLSKILRERGELRGMRGLSLIETVVTVSILALTLMVIINLVPGVYILQSRARFRVAAHEVAHSILEERRARPFQDLVTGGPVALPDRTIEGTSIVLRPSLTISELPPHKPTDLLLLHVEVKWDYKDKTERIVHELRLLNLPR